MRPLGLPGALPGGRRAGLGARAAGWATLSSTLSLCNIPGRGDYGCRLRAAECRADHRLTLTFGQSWPEPACYWECKCSGRCLLLEMLSGSGAVKSKEPTECLLGPRPPVHAPHVDYRPRASRPRFQGKSSRKRYANCHGGVRASGPVATSVRSSRTLAVRCTLVDASRCQ